MALATSFERCARVFKAMGSPCELLLDTMNKEHGRQVLDALVGEITRLEQKYSRFRADSLVSRINRSAGDPAGIAVDPETAGLLDYAATCHTESDGLFDITSGSLRKLWQFAGPGACTVLPGSANLREVLATVGWHKVQWQAPVLVLPLAGMEIDLGGIVKEYAVDRCVALARAAGVDHGLVNLGGDLGCIGPPAAAQGWIVGISRPDHPAQALATIELRHGALATSGDYQRCIDIAGKHYSHILDPRTGWPVSGLASASVLADHCRVAGSAATIALLRGDGGECWLEALGLPWLGVRQDGSSSGTIALAAAPDTGRSPATITNDRRESA